MSDNKDYYEDCSHGSSFYGQRIKDGYVVLNNTIYDFESVAKYMDDDIREELFRKDIEKEQEFLDLYVKRHYEEFGEDFYIN